MRIRGILFGIWLGLCAFSPVHAASPVDAVLAEVSSALAQGAYQDAVALADSGLSEPGISDLVRGRLLLARGLARQALGANDEALADFTGGLSVAALPPQERAQALFARGVSLDSLGRLDDAVGDYSAVLGLAPGASYALNNRANVYRRQGRLDEARRDYLAALNRTNSNPQYPYFGLGQIAEAQGDVEAARNFYSKAIAADPGFQLALERMQALGAPAEGPSGLPADTGAIVLRPPPVAAGRLPIALKPPDAVAGNPAPAVPKAAPQASRQTSVPAPGWGAPLRPAIVEGNSVPMAQLGAWRSEAEARKGWEVAKSSAGGLLDGLTPVIARAEIPGRGVFYRLRVKSSGPLLSFCAALTQKNVACIPAR